MQYSTKMFGLKALMSLSNPYREVGEKKFIAALSVSMFVFTVRSPVKNIYIYI